MTTAKLDELEKLLAKATPGPWDAHDYDESYAGDRRYQIQEQSGAHRRGDKVAAVLGYFEDEQVPTPEARANARLVAAMRSALPTLIAKLRAAEVLAARVDRALYDFGDEYPGRLDPVSDALDAFRKVQP